MWLYAITAIAIPLIIHLWDVRGGKKLQVGSILLIQESARQQGRRLRLTDILLLMLRCLLIILLALILSQPHWKKQLTASDEKGWIMMEQENLPVTYQHFKPEIDSLIKTGYKFHYFNKEFLPSTIEDAIANKNTTSQQFPYWVLLRELNESVPAELPIHLYTGNQLKRFSGSRPEVSMALTWQTYSPDDSISAVPILAYKTATDSIQLINVNSNAHATYYTSKMISNTGNPEYKISDNIIHARSGNEVIVDTSAIKITVYTDQFSTDVSYLVSAIKAIHQVTQLNIQLSFVKNEQEIEPENDWLFWLSEKPLPPQVLASNIFLYTKGKIVTFNSWIRTDNLNVNQNFVSLSRKIENQRSNTFEALWKDGFGNPLLTKEKFADNYIYKFYTRFNPEWNDLPWSTQFPEMIFELLMDKNSDYSKFDKRIIDAGQLQPTFLNSKIFDKENFIELIDLSRFFWIIAFIVFCIERYLSLKEKKPKFYA